MSIGVLLVGIGGYGANYVDEVLDRPSPAYQVMGICDPMAARSPRYGEIVAHGFPLFPDYASALKAKPDLVVIASPIHTHYGYLKQAIEQGIPCLTEKPVTMSLDELDSLIELSNMKQVPVAVGYQMCYRSDIRAIKQDILSGLYGKAVGLKALRLMRRGMNYYGRASWAGKLMVGTEPVYDSPLTNACAHDFENMVYLLGKTMDETAQVASVRAKLYRANPNIENFDAIAMCATTTLGVPMYYYAAHCLAEKKVGPFAEYRFEKGTIKPCDGSYVAVDGSGAIVKDYRPIGEGNRLEKFQMALRMVSSGEKPWCTMAMAREHVVTVQEVQKLPVEAINVEPQSIDDDVCYPLPGIEKDFASLYTKALDTRKEDFS